MWWVPKVLLLVISRVEAFLGKMISASKLKARCRSEPNSAAFAMQKMRQDCLMVPFGLKNLSAGLWTPLLSSKHEQEENSSTSAKSLSPKTPGLSLCTQGSVSHPSPAHSPSQAHGFVRTHGTGKIYVSVREYGPVRAHSSIRGHGSLRAHGSMRGHGRSPAANPHPRVESLGERYKWNTEIHTWTAPGWPRIRRAQLVSQPVSQLVSQPMSQPVSQPMSQPLSQPMSQPVLARVTAVPVSAAPGSVPLCRGRLRPWALSGQRPPGGSAAPRRARLRRRASGGDAFPKPGLFTQNGSRTQRGGSRHTPAVAFGGDATKLSEHLPVFALPFPAEARKFSQEGSSCDARPDLCSQGVSAGKHKL